METGNNHEAAAKREIKPIGLNGQKVVGKRYSLKDLNGEPLETWSGHRAARGRSRLESRERSGNA
jgi:hypothetical protein